MNNAFDEVFNRLDMAQERLWELEGMSIILPNIKCREKREWKKNRLSNNFGTIAKGITFGIPEEKKEQRRNT